MCAAREINAPLEVDETLRPIVRAAAASMPGIDDVGISIEHKNGKVETVVATGPVVWELDRLRYDTGEGPCLYAIS